MPDPIDALDNFDPGAPMDPLPASEVRRRGDRRRRRTTSLAGVGAALAVAAVVTPLALLGHDEPRTLPPADRSTVPAPAVTTIPDGLDLTVGMAQNESGGPVVQTQRDTSAVQLEICGVDALDSGDVVNRVAASASGPEYAEDRELRVYSDTAAATAAVENVRQAVADCPTEQFSSTTWVHRLLPSELGEDATVATLSNEDNSQAGLGGSWWQVVRVGNAVLVASTRGEYGDDLSGVIADDTVELAPIVDQLSVFSADTVTTPPNETGELSEAALITADQVPARDRLGPWTEVPAAQAPPTLACLPQGLAPLEAERAVTRSFSAASAPQDGVPASDTPISAVNVAVLQYDDQEGVDQGYETVQGMIAACNADLAGLRPQGGTIEVPPYGSYRTFAYAAPDICTDCDAFRFDRMGAAVVDGDRLVLVSLAEVGGPLEPEGLDATMSALMDVAIAQAPR